MIYSMTGYAISTIKISNTSIQLELKTVNHRFLDCSIRATEEFKILEAEIRELITSKINRGKVEFRVYLKEDDNQINSNVSLNTDKLNNYLHIIKQIKQISPELNNSSITDILELPGVIVSDTIKTEELKQLLLQAIAELCTALKNNQRIEGKKLTNVILDKTNQIDVIVNTAQTILPKVINNYKDKLKDKLLSAFEESITNEPRFSQEFTYFCQKIDVDEELIRLTSHTKQLRALLTEGGSVGKKIDFITQEMLREANTFGSKSVSHDTTLLAVELKVLIEQIKEQIQNIA